ncbi:MAG: hypothetical protein AAGI15_00550 [Pseudomonadota bacterium]
MSAYSIAKEQVAAALAAGVDSGVDTESLLRALIATAVTAYREDRGVADTRSMLEFQLTNCAGDEDFEFMRP